MAMKWHWYWHVTSSCLLGCGVARGAIKALEKESALSHPSPSLWGYLCLSSFPFDHFTFLSIFERRQGEKEWANCQISLIFCFIVPLTVWEQIESFRIMGKKESLGSVIDSHDIWSILCSFRKLNSSWMYQLLIQKLIKCSFR